jgi:hypothetical protein
MEWFSTLVNFAVFTLQVCAVVFFAYGAYLAIYRKDLWPKPPEQGRKGAAPGEGPADLGSALARRHDRRLRVQRLVERRAMHGEIPTADRPTANR